MRIILARKRHNDNNSAYEFVANISDTNSVLDINDGFSNYQQSDNCGGWIWDAVFRITGSDKVRLNDRGYSIVSRVGEFQYHIIDSEHDMMKPYVRDIKLEKLINI